MLLEGDAVDVAGFGGWSFVGFVHLEYLNGLSMMISRKEIFGEIYDRLPDTSHPSSWRGSPMLLWSMRELQRRPILLVILSSP